DRRPVAAPDLGRRRGCLPAPRGPDLGRRRQRSPRRRGGHDPPGRRPGGDGRRPV
ncbi:MAG: hypothetical protein AVDCRST_MAG59-3780, partial [uncultured Thermomicrobiales bacterium]